MTDKVFEVLTIGHSTLSYEQFIQKLRIAGVTAIADVRTVPFSRYLPHFNHDILCNELRSDSIAYVFLGDELGGRPKAKELYCEGVADYEKMAQTEHFSRGLDRIVQGAQKFKIAMMCSEQDPLDCHRCLLVGRALSKRDCAVRHILSDDSIIAQSAIESQLLNLAGRTGDDLFDSLDRRLAAAYARQSMKVAYAECKVDSREPAAAE